MKAAIVRRYGPPEVVQVGELPDPVAGEGEILVAVTAAAVTSGDARIRGADMPPGFGAILGPAFGFGGPRRPIPGLFFAGTVAALGPRASGFAVGERVFGTTGMRAGTNAELLTIAAKGRVMPVPGTLTDVEAAAFLFGGQTAADFLIAQAAVQRGERLLVIGATGSVGSGAVQIGRHLGAHVTALCSAGNAGLARNLGADEVIDYRAGPLSGRYDVILDVPGRLTVAEALPLLSDGGRLCMVTSGLGPMIGALLRPRRGTRRLCAKPIAETREAMERLIAIHATGGYRPHVGATLPLDRIAEAHAIAGSGHATGNTVVTMAAYRPA